MRVRWAGGDAEGDGIASLSTKEQAEGVEDMRVIDSSDRADSPSQPMVQGIS